MEQTGLILKVARPHALATLIRLLGDFDLAEEAIQEAIYRAIKDWEEKTIPDNPVAWLVQTGRRYAMDLIRHRNMVQRHNEKMILEQEINEFSEENIDYMHLPDDRLRLIFTCCHPALTFEAQVALTLKTIADFSIDEISRAFLLTSKTIEQRLTRAKRKIRDAKIPYIVPQSDELPTRLTAVMSVIYLIYNQAYTATSGSTLIDIPLSETAINLARLLNRLMRDNAEVQGLLALLLLQHSRAAARTTTEGIPIPLEQQDRTLWNQKLIIEGQALVEKSLRHEQPGSYTLQAAIAAVHCKGKNAHQINWKEIVLLYDLLLQLTNNPVVRLNQAIAVSRAQSIQAGLVIVKELEDEKKLVDFQYYHSTKANLLEESGDLSSALLAYKQAFKLCKNDAELKFLQSKIDYLLDKLV